MSLLHKYYDTIMFACGRADVSPIIQVSFKVLVSLHNLDYRRQAHSAVFYTLFAFYLQLNHAVGAILAMLRWHGTHKRYKTQHSGASHTNASV